MLQYEEGVLDQSSIIPMVDGGTEGFKGNARVILPGMSACVECTLDLYPPQVHIENCITGIYDKSNSSKLFHKTNRHLHLS